MRFVSLDLETSGLSPESGDQILEVGVVVHTRWDAPVEELPAYRWLVRHERLSGNPVALSMNARLVAEMCRPAGADHILPGDVRPLLHTVLTRHLGEPKWVAAGKNFANFDLRFLVAAGVPREWFAARTLDPVALFARPDDVYPPDLTTCLRRAGLEPSNLHTALDDARDVVRCLRAGITGRGEG